MTDKLKDTTTAIFVTTSSSFASNSTMSTSVASGGSKNAQYTTSTSVKASTTVKTTKTTIKSSSTSSSVAIKSSGESFVDHARAELGIDLNKELDRLKIKMDDEVDKVKAELFHLVPLAKVGSGNEMVKLDTTSIDEYVDQAHKDRLKFNFDVHEYESESINVRTVGNTIEVHGKKKSKKGDEEKSEEYTRVYEMPTEGSVDPAKVTSSFYKDGILTIELPTAAAKGAK